MDSMGLTDEQTKLSGKGGGGRGSIGWEEIGDRFDDNSLYACMNFSNKKSK